MTYNKVKKLVAGAEVVIETAMVQYVLSELKPIDTNGKLAKILGFVVADALLLYKAKKIATAQ